MDKIKYTAFLDILGFSDYVKTNIKSDSSAKLFYNNLNHIFAYLEDLKSIEHSITSSMIEIKDIIIKHTWISDTFIISVEYNKEDENKQVSTMMIYMLSMAISQIYHFLAEQYDFLIRGGISSKYTFINEKIIIGEGIVEAHNLEAKVAIYPRVIFADDIITDKIQKNITLLYQDNNLDIISKDCDGYYFVNYIGSLQNSPPQINKYYSYDIKDLDNLIYARKIEILKRYQSIIEIGLKHKNLSIQIKYMWLQNYKDKVLSLGSIDSYNMFAYNILPKAKQDKLKEEEQKQINEQ